MPQSWESRNSETLYVFLFHSGEENSESFHLKLSREWGSIFLGLRVTMLSVF